MNWTTSSPRYTCFVNAYTSKSLHKRHARTARTALTQGLLGVGVHDLCVPGSGKEEEVLFGPSSQSVHTCAVSPNSLDPSNLRLGSGLGDEASPCTGSAVMGLRSKLPADTEPRFELPGFAQGNPAMPSQSNLGKLTAQVFGACLDDSIPAEWPSEQVRATCRAPAFQRAI